MHLQVQIVGESYTGSYFCNHFHAILIYACNQNAPSDKLKKDETTATYEYALCTEKKKKSQLAKEMQIS